jgi:hypothetical protein
MNQKLLWNFEFSPMAPQTPVLTCHTKEKILWEMRFFWPIEHKIVLGRIDDSLLDLNRYKNKFREDTYYLLPDSNQNIKLRGDAIFYKPILKKTPEATGFGAKIDLDDQSVPLRNTFLNYIHKNGTKIFISKEAYIYKFATNPSIKLELTKLQVYGHYYTSICIEGRSLDLVQTIKQGLLKDQVSCDYVTFLKNIVPS